MFLPVQVKSSVISKIKAGHPWVMAKEISNAHRGLQSGSLCDVVDDKGQFLGRGYYNSKSQISVRIMTWNGAEKNINTVDYLSQKVFEAWQRKKEMGFKYSFRLVFSEGDFLPGLIIDHYQVIHPDTGKKAFVFSFQISTYGMSRLIQDPVLLIEALAQKVNAENKEALPWEDVVILLRNDISVRDKEGLRVEVPRFLRTLRDFDFSKARILVNNCLGRDMKPLQMDCNLYTGQKTGFFLDQQHNISLVAERLVLMNLTKVRILDLCCYVGHWSSQLAAALKTRGVYVETTLVDVSKEALDFARSNAERAGADLVHIVKKDVLKELDELDSESFELVIADPPAFMKSKKDFATGFHAYFKLNAQAFRVATQGGWVVSCSCSGHLKEKDLELVLEKSLKRSNRNAEFILSGGPSMDHPMKSGFSDGTYLKMIFNQV
jgi:23S rRNA (cytosine1962-C5)-methyltransferase